MTILGMITTKTAILFNQSILNNPPDNSDLLPGNVLELTMLAWTLLTSVTSLLGNTVVVVATLKVGVIKLDRATVILIRNIAVADMGFAVRILLTVEEIVNKRVDNGGAICFATLLCARFFAWADAVLICALNISKLGSLRRPFENRLRTAKCGHLLAAFVWAAAGGSALVFCISLLSLSKGVDELVKFCPSSLHCCYTSLPFFIKNMSTVFSVIWVILPTVCIIVTTVALFRFVYSVSGLSRQSVMTLLLISTVFAGKCFVLTLLPKSTIFWVSALS